MELSTDTITECNYSFKFFKAVAIDDLRTVKTLLDEKLCAINDIVLYNDAKAIGYEDEDKQIYNYEAVNAVDVACRFGSLNVLRYFESMGFDFGLDVIDWNDNFVIKFRSINRHTEMLGDNNRLEIYKLDYKLIETAIKCGHFNVVKFLMKKFDKELNKKYHPNVNEDSHWKEIEARLRYKFEKKLYVEMEDCLSAISSYHEKKDIVEFFANR
jgi:hypothetical protein